MFLNDLYDNNRLLMHFILTKKAFSTNLDDVKEQIEEFVVAMKSPSTKAKEFIAGCKSPMNYWHQVGSTQFPLLYKVARIVFSVPTSQAASERVWSIYDFILTKRRNRMSPDKVTKLVQLYMNADLVPSGSVVSVMMGEESDCAECDDE